MNITPTWLRYKYYFRDFLKGSPMRKTLNEIIYINNHPIEGEAICQKKLQDMITFAKQNTTFYGDVAEDNLESFPVINKKIILDNRDAFLVNPKDIPGQEGDLYVKKTSGSTGTPFSIPQDTQCRLSLIAMIKYGNELVGFKSFDRLMHLRSLKHFWTRPGESKGNLKLDEANNIVYADNSDLDESKALEICHAINRYKVKFIRGYMTSLDIITQCAVKHGIIFNERPVFISGGEALKESLRKRVTEQLNCKIISQYANEENGIMSQSPLAGGDVQILNRGNCHIELLKFDSDEPVEEGEVGRIVVTDFTNHAMPLIRYDVGDAATIGEIKNGILMSFGSLIGRRTDLIFNTKGQFIDLFNSISKDIYLNEGILQYQFIQKGPKEYTLKLNLRDYSLRAKEENFKEMIRETLGQDANVNIDFVQEIPVLNSGKSKVIINEWKSLA